MKKRILLDALSLTLEKPKGVQRYIINLLKEFSAFESGFDFTVLLRKEGSVSDLPRAARLNYVRIPYAHPTLWRLFNIASYAQKGGFGLLHIMGEGDSLRHITVPYIMTIHESPRKYYEISEKKPGRPSIKRFINRKLSLALRGRMLKEASALIAVSKSTKKDIAFDYGISGSSVRVIYNAAEEHFFAWSEKEKPEREDAEPYILAFATNDRRENLAAELAAFKAVKDDIPHSLFIAGVPEGPFRDRLLSACLEMGISDRVKLFSFLTEKELGAMYKGADLYVDMSFLEGFGLQVCEAMASGAPVIASNAGALPEVMGNAGVMLDPRDMKGLGCAIKEVLSDPARRKRMASDGRQQARLFSWKNAAKDTLELYEEILCRKSQ